MNSILKSLDWHAGISMTQAVMQAMIPSGSSQRDASGTRV